MTGSGDAGKTINTVSLEDLGILKPICGKTDSKLTGLLKDSDSH